MDRPDIQEMLALRVAASERRNELLEECQRLRDAGRTAAARRALAAAEKLQQLLTSLEQAVRPR